VHRERLARRGSGERRGRAQGLLVHSLLVEHIQHIDEEVESAGGVDHGFEVLDLESVALRRRGGMPTVDRSPEGDAIVCGDQPT